jgi:hypothetical protein
MTEARCMGCRSQQLMKNETYRPTKKNTMIILGICAVCGTKMSKIAKLDPAMIQPEKEEAVPPIPTPQNQVSSESASAGLPRDIPFPQDMIPRPQVMAEPGVAIPIPPLPPKKNFDLFSIFKRKPKEPKVEIKPQYTIVDVEYHPENYKEARYL